MRKVGVIDVGLFAHRDYLARHGEPHEVADLASHALIGYDVPGPVVRSASGAWQAYARERFSLCCDSDLAQMALIRAGAGIGGCQVLLAARDSALQRVLPQALTLPLETWVTMHEDLRSSLGCREAFDALVEGLQSYTAGTLT